MVYKATWNDFFVNSEKPYNSLEMCHILYTVQEKLKYPLILSSEYAQVTISENTYRRLIYGTLEFR